MSSLYLHHKLPALILFCLAIAAATAGCDDKKPSYPTAPASGILHFVNLSSRTVSIFRFRMSGENADIWSANSLAGPLLPGAEDGYHLPPGTFDIRLETADYWNPWTETRLIEIVANKETIYAIYD